MATAIKEYRLIDRLWRAKYGTRDQQRQLIDDESERVRVTLAMYGTPSTQMKMAQDTSPQVRETLARFGSKTTQQLLLHDPDWRVRRELALYGDEYIRDALNGDTYQGVQTAINDIGGQEVAQQRVQEYNEKLIAVQEKRNDR